jgi:hypothetical protein
MGGLLYSSKVMDLILVPNLLSFHKCIHKSMKNFCQKDENYTFNFCHKDDDYDNSKVKVSKKIIFTAEVSIYIDIFCMRKSCILSRILVE